MRKGSLLAATILISERLSQSIRDPKGLCAGFARRKDLLLRAGQQALTLKLLASELSVTGNAFSLFPCALFRRLLIGHTGLDFTEKTFALHALLEDAKRLVDIVVSH